MVEQLWEPDPSFWRDRPTLVTGATGFLGSHMVKILSRAGAAVVVVVRDEVPPTPIVDQWETSLVTAVRGDVRDQELLERALGEYEIVSVIHLAAQTQVQTANRNPISTWDSNIRGMWSLLEACRRTPTVGQITVASSDKAYGAQPVLPYTEDMPLIAVNPYDVSKACADLVAMSYHHAFGAPVAVTRCGNFFGPGDTNWARVVPGTARSLLRGERPVIRSDGSPTRDYLHVEDGALAYLRVIEAMAADPTVAGQAYNFSTETPLSVLQLVKLIGEAAGRPDLEPDVQASATLEIDHQFLSAEKARRVLSWAPRYGTQEALDHTVAWYREFLARSG
ncbi:MAG: CDP-glucose 4,6-dehydratase [Actinomycetota bacterium]|jgi:CDP-glucose 4,6-dehydratase